MPVARNILLIMTDQHRNDTVSRLMGDRYVQTPALDRLASESLVFDRAFTASPVCIPARDSIFTGLYPHQTQVECNRYHPRNTEVDRCADYGILPRDIRGVGCYFADAGYETAYFGKWHINMRKEAKDQHGFRTTGVLEQTGHDQDVADATTDYLSQVGTKPFFAVCSFSNPHDVCQLADGRPLPGGQLPAAPGLDQLPPLPDNMGPGRNETAILTELREAYYQVHVEQRYNSEDEQRRCRELAWGYYRLVEGVDALVGKVLLSLEEAGLADDTLVIYTSDHGELLGAHGLVQKTFFYEEATHVPLYVRVPGTDSGSSNALVNTGVDLLPTMLDSVGLSAPDALPGSSLLPHARSPVHSESREYVIGQVHLCSPKMPEATPRTYARMVRSDRYNYWLLDQGAERQILFDTAADPGETTNLSYNPAAEPILRSHRASLRRHAEATNDTRAIAMLRAVETK